MVNIFNIYQLGEKLYEGNNSVVYRGNRSTDQQPVILKILKNPYPTPEEVARFRREYEITRKLSHEATGIIKALDFETYENRFMIILEDIGGVSLAQLLEQKILKPGIAEFLRLGLQITAGLEEIHRHQAIHKDINPANIVRNPTTGTLKIIDFSIAALLHGETVKPASPETLEGTLAYISPEQTGRMNRTLDYRTDFYSLGVTFYELLTSQLPFDTRDPMELTHAHIARTPLTPDQLDVSIPTVVSDVIMKLMGKNAEDRYQSTLGLKHDLRECLEQLTSMGKCRYFTLGKKDIGDHLNIPQKLYGRQKEIKFLLEAFTHSSEGSTALMLVTGGAGIGKTSLVHEIYKPLVHKRGYFISGKCAQFKRRIPYASLIQAFQELVRQLLTEGASNITQWKGKILEAVGRNAQLLNDVIPDMELIIGKHDPVPQLPPLQAQNRFNQVFQNFLRVFAAPEHPLTIYLDDMQWIDLPSLKLVELFMTGLEHCSLFFLGAYRDNELDPAHPLMLTLNALKAKGVRKYTLALSPLEINDVNHLVSDTLYSHPQKTQPLAELCLRKTGGNPFFLKQFLQTLYYQQLIRLDRENMCWYWDIEKISRADITENVVDLMVARMRKIAKPTQHALKLAAAVGNRFTLKILAEATQQTFQETTHHLWQALQENFISPTDERYSYAQIPSPTGFKSIAGLAEFRFNHDRIQEAAYSLIEPDRRAEIHLKVGRLMMEKIPKDIQEEKIFDIVNHLNRGKDLIIEPSEKFHLAELNLRAGLRAKDAIAYESALKYFSRGINLLGNTGWQRHFDLSFRLYKNYVECLYLCGDFTRSAQTIFMVMEKLVSPVDKAVFYNQLIIQYTMAARYQEAIDLTFRALDLLNIDLHADDYAQAIPRERAAIKSALQTRSIASLIDLPEITDPSLRMGITLLSEMLPICYFINQELYSFAITRTINLALQYGHIAGMAFVYVSYGLILVGKYQEYDEAYEFGSLALNLSVKFANEIQKCKVAQNFANHIYIWKKPIDGAKEINRECFDAGLNSGEVQFPGYGRNNQALNRYFQGEPLGPLLADIQDYLHFTKKTNNLIATDTLNAVDLVLRNLNNETKSIFSFHNPDFRSAKEFMEQCRQHSSWYAVCAFLVHQAQVFYLFQEYRKAFSCMKKANELIAYMPGSIVAVDQNVYESLILVQRCSTHTKNKKKFLAVIEKNQEQLKFWADHCPGNFLHLFLLVKAELARLTGDQSEAMKWYDRSIELAGENGFTRDEALVNELAGRFYLDLGIKKIALLHITDAHYKYKIYGAIRKVRDLEKRYPHLLPMDFEEKGGLIEPAREKSHFTTVKEKSHTETTPQILDIMAFVRASQALAGEIFLEKLLKKMMEIVLENAGAEKGFFLLEKDGRLILEAIGIINDPDITLSPAVPLDMINSYSLSTLFSRSIVDYVTRTRKTVILADALREEQFAQDSYIIAQKPRSILCMPLVHQDRLTGVLYLENNVTSGAFTAERVEVLELLSVQMAISIENARIHDRLEKLVEKRTGELRTSYEKLRKEIAERKKDEESLKASEEKFARAFHYTPSLIIISDIEDGRILEVNDSFSQVLEYSHEELVGHTTGELNLWVVPEKRQRFIEEVKQHQVVRSMEVEVRKKSGESCFLLFSAVIIQLGGKPHILTSAIDITERRKLEEQLHTAAITDELTGLYNRRGFFALAQQQCKLANRTRRCMSLLYMDLDNMKAINDHFGHQTGDEALVDTSNILKKTFRQSDIIGRIGGDEFAVLLTEHTESDIEPLISSHVRSNFYLHNLEAGRLYYLSISIGIVQYNPEFSCSFGDLLIKADAAMYKDKRQRKYHALKEKLKKRRHKRYPVHDYWTTLDGAENWKIKNISMGGLCLKTTKRLSYDTLHNIEFSFASNGGAIFRGKIVWSHITEPETLHSGEISGYEAGVKFIKLSKSQKKPLKEFLRSL